MLNVDDAGGQYLRCLLSASNMNHSQAVEMNTWHELEANYQPQEQIVWQVESAEPVKQEFLTDGENIIQHIPVTYLTADNPNLSFANARTLVKPITYVLSRNVVTEPSKFTSEANILLNETQKILFVQEVDSSAPQACATYEESRVYAAKGIECSYKGENSKRSKKSKKGDDKPAGMMKGDEPAGIKAKPKRKISGSKKSLKKRKNSKIKSKLKAGGKPLMKKPKKALKALEEEKGEEKERRNLFELTKLEDNVDQVAERLKIGCECSDSNCFDGLNPESVFKHRLNIADLTKAEHDMYLMGVIMASVQNLEETCRHKERIRIRSCYAYQGKRVCLTAFLYLQHVTLYQMKRLRSHLKNHGVSPRIHGNRGRKPANTFSLDIYRRATNFVQNYIEKHCVRTVPNFTTFSSNKFGSISISGSGYNGHIKKGNKIKIANKMTSYHLPPECTKKTVHREYKSFCESLKPNQKVMKYSTFTNFLKKQFPNVKFHKLDKKQEDRGQRGVEASTEEQSVDKSSQTVVYFPAKSVQHATVVSSKEAPLGAGSPEPHILFNGHHLEFYSGNEDAKPDSRFVGSQLYGSQCVSETSQATHQIYAVDSNV